MIKDLKVLTARAGVNQIRGTTVAGSTGAGIPTHVTSINAAVANAQVGSTSTVTVTFKRDPSDTAFSGVKVWVKGYQSNQTPTLVASGTDSPITCVLNNTGETLSMTVQAYGNSGHAPINTAPTTGIVLPKSSSGGAGTSSSTGLTSLGLSMPGEFTVSGSPRTSNGNIVVGKASESANTVWAGPTSGGATAPTFRGLVSGDVPAANLASSSNGGVTGVLPVANGGSGSASPSLVAGSNITVTGSWPNQTVAGSGGGAVISTAGQGGFYGMLETVPNNYLSGSSGNLLANNTVFGVQFVLKAQYTVRHIVWASSNPSGTSVAPTMDVGIYDATFANLLLHSGAVSISTTALTVYNTTISAVVLNPGVYNFAYTGNATSGITNISYYAIPFNPDLNGLVNANGSRWWSKASGATAGVLPNSISSPALRATNTSYGPLVLFEP